MTTARKLSIIGLTVLLSLGVFITPSFSDLVTCRRAKIKAITGHAYGEGVTVDLISDDEALHCNGIAAPGEFRLFIPAEHTYKILNILLTAAATHKRVQVSYNEGVNQSPGELFAASMRVID